MSRPRWVLALVDRPGFAPVGNSAGCHLIDQGNGIQDINPNHTESISVPENLTPRR